MKRYFICYSWVGTAQRIEFENDIIEEYPLNWIQKHMNLILHWWITIDEDVYKEEILNVSE